MNKSLLGKASILLCSILLIACLTSCGFRSHESESVASASINSQYSESQDDSAAATIPPELETEKSPHLGVGKRVLSSDDSTIGVRSDGSCISVSSNIYTSAVDVSDWRDIAEVWGGSSIALGLKNDGSVVAASSSGELVSPFIEATDWTGIIDIDASSFDVFGVRSDGTVACACNEELRNIAYGAKSAEEIRSELSEWTNIVSIACCDSFCVGLRSDGTVVAINLSTEPIGGCNVEEWTDIVSVSIGGDFSTIGLRSDGTVCVTDGVFDTRPEMLSEIQSWTDIKALSSDRTVVAGLRSDGTVVAAGSDWSWGDDVYAWKDIVDICVGHNHIIGVRSNGDVVVSASSSWAGKQEVSSWTGIKTS